MRSSKGKKVCPGEWCPKIKKRNSYPFPIRCCCKSCWKNTNTNDGRRPRGTFHFFIYNFSPFFISKKVIYQSFHSHLQCFKTQYYHQVGPHRLFGNRWREWFLFEISGRFLSYDGCYWCGKEGITRCRNAEIIKYKCYSTKTHHTIEIQHESKRWSRKPQMPTITFRKIINTTPLWQQQNAKDTRYSYYKGLKV